MIGDYKGGDETVLGAALEVFDLLSNTLAEYTTAMSPKALSTADASGLTPSIAGKPSTQVFENTMQYTPSPLRASTRAPLLPDFDTHCNCAGMPATRLQPPSYQQNPFQPPPSVGNAVTAPGKKADEEAPLISFD